MAVNFNAFATSHHIEELIVLIICPVVVNLNLFCEYNSLIVGIGLFNLALEET